MIPQLTIAKNKAHWSHSDSFGNGENEYIKSFIHHNYSLGFHTHSFYELNIVVSGSGYHYIESMACEAKCGCVFLIPPHIKHGYLSIDNLNVYHMLIHRDFINSCFKEIIKTEGYFLLFEIEPHLRAHYDENMFLTLSDEELDVINQDIRLMEKCKTMPASDIFLNATAKKLLCSLCMLMVEKSGTESNKTETKKELLNIADSLNFIHQNFDQPLTVEILAGRLHMSRSTFIRHFTRMCGCSPHHYVQSYRIKKAKEYLAESNKTATRIAQECGFYDVSHMRKCLAEEK